jgi:hemoglobin
MMPDSSRRPHVDPSEFGIGDGSYRAAGERPGIAKLVDSFYRIMDELPEAQTIRRMHPLDLAISRDKLERFLCGWLNGPHLFTEKYGPIKIPKAHAHLRVGPREQEAWLHCMELAIAEQDYSAEFGAYLLQELRVPAQRIVDVSRDPLEPA